MKKIYLFTLLFAIFGLSSFAQKAAESSEKSPLGSSGNAIVINLEAQAKNVEDVLEKRFKKLKDKKEKGFVKFEGQVIEEISPNTLDMYYKVESGKNNQAKVIVFLSKGYENWMSSADNPAEIAAAIKLLDGLINEVRKYELGLAIEAQTKVLEGATKDYEKLVEDGEDLVKDQEKLEKELQENKEDQEANKQSQEEQKNVVGEEKKVLEELQKQLGNVK